MMESPAIDSLMREQPPAASRQSLWPLLAFAAFVVIMCLDGCASVQGARSSVQTRFTGRVQVFDPSVLHRGMSMDEVQSLEPRPTKMVSMASQSMTITEWIYEPPTGSAKLYFANGVLESWTK